MAALRAKKDGDMDLARDYLRQAKGIDPLLDASSAGLPVDMNSIPLSPEAKLQLEEPETDLLNTSDEGFTVISSMGCPEEATGTDQEIYENLEEQLKKQIKVCTL
jgi:coiled-coil and C2 domain-containing protein 1